MSPVAPTVCEQLADYVVGLRYEDIPAAVTTKAKDHLLHLLGNALRSPGWAAADGAVRAAATLSGSTGRCTIIGHRERADALDALFANSVLMSKDGLEDAVFPPGVHPGVVTQPVAWAFGEAARASGRELLVAVVAGYDVMTKLCGQVWTWTLDPPRRPNSVVAPFGGAATASRLLGLTPRQTAFAFGHAGQTGMGIVEGSGHMWTISPLLARNGAMAAVMASAGMESSLTVVEGRYGVFETFFRQPVPDDLLVTLGEQFELERATIKRQPGSLFNYVPLELAESLVDDHGLKATDVEEVVVWLPSERAPREAEWERAALRSDANSTSRLGSLRFRVAMLLLDGCTDLARGDAPPGPELSEVLGKIRLAFEDGHPLAYARIEVATTSGRKVRIERDRPTPAVVDWADWLAVGGRTRLTDGQLARLLELVEHLEDVDDVGEILACVVPAPPAG